MVLQCQILKWRCASACVHVFVFTTVVYSSRSDAILAVPMVRLVFAIWMLNYCITNGTMIITQNGPRFNKSWKLCLYQQSFDEQEIIFDILWLLSHIFYLCHCIATVRHCHGTFHIQKLVKPFQNTEQK